MELTKQQIKNLKDKKFRKQNRIFFVEGEKFCADILHYGAEILFTITTNKALKGYPNLCVVSEQVLAALSTTKTNQNILCVCKIKDFEIGSVGNSLILDTVQDPGNVGTLIRSAMAFGFEDVYLVNCADAYSEKVGSPINQIRFEKNKIAVIIGNEGNGVSEEFRSLANLKISIPMSGKVESLNAGVAGSIIMQKISEVRNVRS